MMKIAQSIEALELTANVMGRTNVIYPTLIWDENTAVLVDAGFPGMLPIIREAAQKAGVDFDKISKIILTHQDIDHIGGLPDVKNALGDSAKIIAHTEEKPYIQGDTPLIKMNPAHMQRMIQNMPEPARAAFEKIMNNPPKAAVDTTVEDGEELPFCGGITVIHTPGHTPGHICLYHKPSKTLIAGDGLVVTDGELNGPRPAVAQHIDIANQSLEKLLKFDIETVVCYHGGVYNDHVNERLAQLVSGK